MSGIMLWLMSNNPSSLASGFPVRLSLTQFVNNTDATSHNVPMPASIAAGDLLIMYANVDGGSGVTPTTPSGWTQIANTFNGGALRLMVYYKVAAGTEGGTTVAVALSAAETLAAHVEQIQAGTYTSTPEASTVALSVDPPSLSPSWGAAKTHWSAIVAQGSNLTSVTYPFASGQVFTSGSSGAAFSSIASCYEDNNTASNNPAAFAVSPSAANLAVTVAVRPV